jgi:hypothetical protein
VTENNPCSEAFTLELQAEINMSVFCRLHDAELDDLGTAEFAENAGGISRISKVQSPIKAAEFR